MSSVVAALDSSLPEPYIFGENGRNQYDWSNNLKEKIVQLHFQLVRKDKITPLNNTALLNEFEEIYKYYYNKQANLNLRLFNDIDAIRVLNILKRLTAFTRDIINGKGEYMLGIEMINRISKYDTDSAKVLIHFFVNNLDETYKSNSIKNTGQQGYGSWKDIKYMWYHFKWCDVMKNYMLELVNTQLLSDLNNISTMQEKCSSSLKERLPVSLVAKWIPREKSKFKALFYALAEHYFSRYLISSKTSYGLIKAKKKAYTQYRKTLSFVNEYLDTTQIKQCANKYSEINYNTVTSITMMKQKKSFLNVDKHGILRSNKKDRIKGAENFILYLNELKEKQKNIKGKRVDIVHMVKQAICENRQYYSSAEIEIINSQWCNLMETVGNLKNFVAMVDTSASMRGDPLMAAIGLGCCVAEKSILGPRVITFNNVPEWVNLANKEGSNILNFTDCINTLKDSPWGGGTNFTAALKLICERSQKFGLNSEDIADMVLVIFSDMQIDHEFNEDINEPMWDHIKSYYAMHGFNQVPTILFWNLRSTTGFPVTSNKKNTLMFSGYSPALLNTFCEKGMTAIKNYTPWNCFIEQLNHKRYDYVGGPINDNYECYL
tara:strand:+ start:1908 stop:3719 length:1812 start_codon:yes stop_codon:yes gene_type:complete